MKRSKFSEEQIVSAIRQAEAGTPVGDLCRQLGVSINFKTQHQILTCRTSKALEQPKGTLVHLCKFPNQTTSRKELLDQKGCQIPSLYPIDFLE